MVYNSYVISLIEHIDFEYYPYFANNSKMIEKANKNLKLFLSLLTEAIDQQITHIAGTNQPIETYLAEKRDELIGQEALEEYSDIVMFEAHYYSKLFKLSDKHFERLSDVLDLYENSETRMQAIQKLNSLILVNICYYGAGQGPDKPIFGLSDSSTSKEQQDLEISILYLLRYMNETNLIVSPSIINPLDIILTDTPQPAKSITQKEDSIWRTFNNSEWILITSSAIVIVAIVIFYINRYIINKRL